MKKIKSICESVGYFFIFSVAPLICALLVSLAYICLDMMNFNLPQLSTYVVEMIACALIILIFYLIFKFKKKADFAYSIKLNKITLSSALSFILFGLSIYFIIMLLMNCVQFFLGDIDASGTNDLYNSVTEINVALLFAAKCIFAPVAEEITFRGLIYSTLKEAFPKWVSSLLASLIFGVLHFSSSVFTVLFATLLGLFNNYLFDKYNSILPGILIHSAYNFMVTFIKYNINNLNFEAYEIPIIAISIIIFIISVIGVIFNTKKLDCSYGGENK